ncbi:hypothetical protein Ahia01_000334300 [Argonauta hians]
MNKYKRWRFTKDKLAKLVYMKDSRLGYAEEMIFRYEASIHIRKMCRILHLEAAEHEAIIYMHRVYVLRSFEKFDKKIMGSACLLVAAKSCFVRCPLKTLVEITRNSLLTSRNGFTTSIEQIYNALVYYEEVVLMSLGFRLGADLPQSHLLNICELIKANEEFISISKQLLTCFMCLTNICLLYNSATIACTCIYIVIRWGNWYVPLSIHGRPWYVYINKRINEDSLFQLAHVFLTRLGNTRKCYLKEFPILRHGCLL